eukprot:Sdes_comp20847_c0_seq3m17568
MIFFVFASIFLTSISCSFAPFCLNFHPTIINQENPKLPAHKFRVGDIVSISPNSKAFQSEFNLSGVVARVTDTRIVIACEKSPNDSLLDEPVRIDFEGSDITYQRIQQALIQLEREWTTHGPSYDLIQVLFGYSLPSFVDTPPQSIDGDFPLLKYFQSATNSKSSKKKLEKSNRTKKNLPGKLSASNVGTQPPESHQISLNESIKDTPQFSEMKFWFNQSLNESQKDAIQFCLSAQHIAVIHGPPGTGKTTTLVELLLQYLLFFGPSVRILACGPSNLSVDNLLEKVFEFAGNHLRLVRIGHPARLLPSVVEHSLESLIRNCEGAEIVNDIRREMDQVQNELKMPLRGKGAVKSAIWETRKKLKQDLNQLRKDLRIREKDCIQRILKNAQIIFTTLVGSSSKLLSNFALSKGNFFDLVIIDEAPQALEAACWIPILKGKKVIIAGDHCQLPPTVLSEKAVKRGFSKTLFDRITELYESKKSSAEGKSKQSGVMVKKMLTTQYRMNENIMRWCSSQMYQNKLECSQKVADQLLSSQSALISPIDETESPLFFIDTNGCYLFEQMGHEDDSKCNDGEAMICVYHIQRLLKAGVSPSSIAIITPYNAQVQLIRNLLVDQEEIEVGSVDGFQGREKDAIIVSLVRSNDCGEIGFLKDSRRLNVALTRARSHLCVIGDSQTLYESGDQFISDMIDYFMEHGVVRSGAEYV